MDSSQAVEPLTTERWLALLSLEHPPADQEVILIRRLKKPYTLTLPKLDLKRCFGDCPGIEVEAGRELRVRGSPAGSRRVELPDKVVQRLGLSPGDLVCITRRRKDGTCTLRRLDIVAGDSEAPGRLVIDAFGDNVVTRTHYSRTDIGGIRLDEVEALASSMGTFTHDPIAPLERVGGRVGFLFRGTLKGGHTREDKAWRRRCRADILGSQEENGSWADSLVATGFQLIRLAELGETASSPAAARAARWLLSAPEPLGMPGLFMATPQLTEEFDAWKGSDGRTGRSPYDAVNRGKLKKYRPIHEAFQRSREVVPGVCEFAMTSATAVVLHALLRLGFTDDRRVRRAIHTLLRLWSGRWCGCGYLSLDRNVAASEVVDFDSIPAPTCNRPLYHGDWFTETRQLLRMTARRKNGPYYTCRQVGREEVLLEKRPGNGGDCTLGVHEALSHHPAYAGSNLEAIAALEFARRQSPLGHWGAGRSKMLHALSRLSHPLAAFLVLRSIPALIRDQHPDGLWSDGARRRDGASHATTIGGNSPDEVVTLRILTALDRFGLLSVLLPRSRR